MRSFERAVGVLQDLANEPMATIEELKRLKAQVENAIGMIETEQLYPMTESERHEHASRYGKGAFVVGDFVIKHR